MIIIPYIIMIGAFEPFYFLYCVHISIIQNSLQIYRPKRRA